MDAGIFENNEGIDLEVSKVKICIDIVEPRDEVYECIFALSGEGWAD